MLYVNPMDGGATRAANSLRAGAPRGAAADPSKEKKALQEFERVFLFQLIREMRNSVPKDGLFGKSGETDFMEEMLDDHYAGEMARSGQFGIAKQMEQQLHARERAVEAAKIGLKPLDLISKTS